MPPIGRLLSCCLLLAACSGNGPLFRELSPAESGIDFANTVTEEAELNTLNYEYLYNGGGVGIGDFNNDSLPDIYFSGNRVPNRLYLNKGGMRFEDATAAAGVDGAGRWCKGVSVLDINNDGRMDIHICAAILPDSNARRNILYVNQGTDTATGIPRFKDMAAEYGLADPSNSQMAAFFDYDNDGDLDVYLLVNDLDGTYPNEFRPIRKDGSWPNTDKLLRNDPDSTLGHPRFTDVSREAGILVEGHGLGVHVADIDRDGWKDVYVSNDYLSNNILYINNRDGTFTDRCAQYLRHTSRNAMGNDIADINNDGLADIVEMDMMPPGNYRQKMMYSDIGYQTFQNSERFGYMYQYPRNTLQLNLGPAPGTADSLRIPVFSEIAYLSGVAQTDWSWAPLLMDADNDGHRDLIVSNGLPKDMSDLDFMSYRRSAVQRAPLSEILQQLPTVKIPNYAFHNNGDLTFSDRSSEWGFTTPTYSAGMAYADFDRDGDLDLVFNNTNMPATLLENRARQSDRGGHYLRIRLKGGPGNPGGFGAMVRLHRGGELLSAEHTPYRGYLSSMEPELHFGLGNDGGVDSLDITWPDGRRQSLTRPPTDRTLTLDIADATLQASPEKPADTAVWLTDISAATGLDMGFRELDFIDFNIQRLLPHKLTRYGPSVAVGDLDGDGREDLVTGGMSPFCATLHFQQRDGRFTRRKLYDDAKAPQAQDDGGICLLDAEGDGDLDIYIASGGAENPPQSKAYADHFYLNDGKGGFREKELAVTNNRTAKGAIAAFDYDDDGDTDLFIAGRTLPGGYPSAVSSFLYRNDSEGGEARFTDVTRDAAPALQMIGMVSSAAWSDADADGQRDLVLAMDWGPVTVLLNKGGRFKRTPTTMDAYTGWWNSILPADLDRDGDMDYIAGNYGTNGFLQPTAAYPVKAYFHDFDANERPDAVFSSFRRGEPGGPVLEYPLSGRDEFLREMTPLKERFPNYAAYANAAMDKVFDKAAIEAAYECSATTFLSGWFENTGNMVFTFHPFPVEAQFAPVFGIVAQDIDGDGHTDIALIGNDHGMSPALGRYDACNGLVLQGLGKGAFRPLRPAVSGLHVPGDGKALAEIRCGDRLSLVAVENTGYMRAFAFRRAPRSLQTLQREDRSVLLRFEGGGMQRMEPHAGGGFLSHSGCHLPLGEGVAAAEVTGRKGARRTIINR